MLNSGVGGGALARRRENMSLMKPVLRLSVALLFLAGCNNVLSALAGPGGGNASKNHAPPENTAPPVDALMGPNYPGLDACAGSVSQNDVADALELAGDFKLSCHELIVCGGLATSLGSAIINVL